MSKHLIENSNNEDEYFLEILYKLKSKIDYLSYKLNYPEANTDLIISLLKIWSYPAFRQFKILPLTGIIA